MTSSRNHGYPITGSGMSSRICTYLLALVQIALRRKLTAGLWRALEGSTFTSTQVFPSRFVPLFPSYDFLLPILPYFGILSYKIGSEVVAACQKSERLQF